MTQVSPPLSPLWQQIVGEDLSAVSFIRNYVRFEFNPPPMIDALTKTLVTTAAGSAALGEPPFANLAISLIGSVVEGVHVEADVAFSIKFVGGAVISVSLRPEDAVGPEAVLFHGHGQRLGIV